VFVDGMRDPAFYERDTFNFDRIEVLRGSASMLFGRGSTGGAVNQVNKVPRLIDENQVDVTVWAATSTPRGGRLQPQDRRQRRAAPGRHGHPADNNGAGTSLDKRGMAATYRWGIGERDEFSVGAYHLDNATA
jgi:catecholate siderophore receptor